MSLKLRSIEPSACTARALDCVPNIAQHRDQLAKVNMIRIHRCLGYGIGQHV